MMTKKFVGQSLIEMLVAIAIVTLLVTGLVAGTTSSLSSGQMSKTRAQALQYAKEGLEVVRIIRDTSWGDIPQTDKTYCLGKGQQALNTEMSGSCPTDIDGLFSRTVTIADDGTACQAPTCRKVTVAVAWQEKEPRNVTLSSYVTNWRTR